MEVYAGFLEHTDAQIGRVMQALAHAGELDRTAVLVVSDNGASPEGGSDGAFNYCNYLNAQPEDLGQIHQKLDDLGGPRAYGHYPYGWAWAGNTPLKRWKQETHEGGIACPLIVTWPGTIPDAGAIRRQYCHAIDVFPTVLQGLEMSPPDTIRGVRQSDIHGFSFFGSIADSAFESRHQTQYYEVRGCRAIYHDGWKAVTYHPRTGLSFDRSDPLRSFSQDVWELYNVGEDFSECNDLSGAQPERLQRMIEMWWTEAGRYNVLPLDNRGSERHAAPKPRLGGPQTVYVFRPSLSGIPQHATVNLKRAAHAIEASVDVSELSNADGVLLAQGSEFGGYSFYVLNRRLRYTYNYLAKQEYEVVSDVEIGLGESVLGYEFVRTSETGGVGILTIDGREVGRSAIPRTIPFMFGPPGYLYVGRDPGDPVCSSYNSPFVFGGVLKNVVVRLTGTTPEELAVEEAGRLFDAIQ
jgi:hypothetical protein